MDLEASAPMAGPPEGVSPRRATAQDIVATGEYEMHRIVFRRGGEWLEAIVRARRLPYKQRMKIQDRHTQVIGTGGRARNVKTDGTAVVFDTLAEMIDGPNCDPPLTRDFLERADNVAFLDALVAKLGLDGSPEQEANRGK